MRNLNKPTRYNVASIQAQQTMGGDVMQSDENGLYVEWRDYKWLLAEKQRLDAEVERLRASSFVTAVPSDNYERVVKTGNALRDDLEALTKSTWFNKCKSVKNWNSATYQ